MISYSYESIPTEFLPDWGITLRKVQFIPYELAAFVAGINPSLLRGRKYKKNIPILEKQLQEHITKNNIEDDISIKKIDETIDRLLLLINSHVKTKHLNGKYSFNYNVYNINIWEFVQWLEYLEIPYPNELKNCYKPPSAKIDPEDKIENNRKVIAAILKLEKVKDKGFRQENLGDEILSEGSLKPLKLNKTIINRVFAASRKLLK